MPIRFSEVIPELLYRGGAPSSLDVYALKNKWNIEQIVSLDLKSAKSIADDCKRLGVKQIVLPVHEYEKDGRDIILDEINSTGATNLVNNKPTYVHCKHGKDRTGMFIARYRTENGWDALRAVEEAAQFGFGIGVGDDSVNSYLEVINNGSDVQIPATLSDWRNITKEYTSQCPICEMGIKRGGTCEHCAKTSSVINNFTKTANKQEEVVMNKYDSQTRKGIVQALKKYVIAQQVSSLNVSQEVSVVDKKMTKNLIENLNTFINLIEILIEHQLAKFIDLFKNNKGITYDIIKELDAEPYFNSLGKNLKKNIWRLIGNRYVELNKEIDENKEKKEHTQSENQKEIEEERLNTIFDVCLELLSKFNKDTHIGPMQKSLEEAVKGLADLVVDFAGYLENDLDNEDMQQHITDMLIAIQDQIAVIKNLVKDRIIYALNKDVLGKDKPYNDDSSSSMTLKKIINREK